MSKQSFFLGQNGGGSDGSFAIIKIDYPDDTLVYVEHEGEVIETPSTKGPWMFGCDEAGLYTVGIDGTDISQEIEITTKGQIESTFISPQVINYALLYYLGNEFSNVEGTDAERYAISTDGWSFKDGSVPYGEKYSFYCGLSTNLYINNIKYSKFFIKIKESLKSSFNFPPANSRCVGSGVASRSLNYNNDIGFSVQNFRGVSTAPGDNYNYNALIQGGLIKTNNPVGILASWRETNSTSQYQLLRGKEGNCIYTAIYDSRDYNRYLYMRVYAIGFINVDDISVLSDYGSSISEILSNAANLFNDISALTRMVLNCTGDFMISSLSNSNFLNAMNASPNKIILTANEHWARFIALTTV